MSPNQITIEPTPSTKTDRRDRLQQIAARVKSYYGDQLLALGVYGSTAKDLDGPFSDIEMHCVLRGTEIEIWHEWSAGPWKAEVNAFSADVMLNYASEFEGEWAMTHGSYVHVASLYDPEDFFPKLKAAALDHTDREFDEIIHLLIVGEIYEMIGKLRNARAQENPATIVLFAAHLAMYGAWLLGLANRCFYTSTSQMFAESLTLPNPPDGYQNLCQLVMAGNLQDAQQVYEISDQFWSGVVKWAASQGIPITKSIDDVFPL